MNSFFNPLRTRHIVLFTILGGSLCLAGVYFLLKVDTAPTAQQAAPAAQNGSNEVPSFESGNHNHDDSPGFAHIHAEWKGPPPHQHSQQDLDSLDTFKSNVRKGIDSGAISRAEGRNLVRQHEARLATKGMSAFDAAQYLLNSPNLRAPTAYLKELADQALMEHPDDPEVLYLWAGRHPYVKEGPNPEREAAYEKILAMDDVPPKLRQEVLDSFAGTVWYYKPEDAIQYLQESRALSEKDAIYYTQGHAYERLGQYDKAMEVYRDYYAQNGSTIAWQHLSAILAGTPYIQPIERPAPRPVAARHTPTDRQRAAQQAPEGPANRVDDFNVPQPMSEADAAQEHARAAQAAQAAHEQQQAQQLQAFQQFISAEFPEYTELLDGPAELHALQNGRIQRLNAADIAHDKGDTPTENEGAYRKKEFENEGSSFEEEGPSFSKPSFVSDTSFASERIRAAKQMLKQYGPAHARRRLRATDPALARYIEKDLERHNARNGGNAQ